MNTSLSINTLRIAFVSVAFCASTLPALACGTSQTVQHATDEANVIMTAQVTKVSNGEGLKIVTVVPMQIWKGLDESAIAKPRTITTSVSAETCGYTFEVGKTYVIYAHRTEEVGIFVQAGRTRELSAATEDLTALGAPIASVPTSDDQFESPFPDVPLWDASYVAANTLKANGVLSGNPDGTFKPDALINRAEFLQMVMKQKVPANTWGSCIHPKTETGSTPVDQPTMQFPDVPNTAWFAEAVCQAKHANVIKGYSDSTFRPDMKINAAEAAKILVQSLAPIEVDEANQGVWYAPYERALRLKKAMPNSVASMDQQITRGEMAQMIYLMMQN